MVLGGFDSLLNSYPNQDIKLITIVIGVNPLFDKNLQDQFTLLEEEYDAISYKDYKFLVDDGHYHTLIVPYSSLKELYPTTKELSDFTFKVNGMWYSEPMETEFFGDAYDTEEVLNDDSIDKSSLQLWIDICHWYDEQQNDVMENVLSEYEQDALYSVWLNLDVETYNKVWALEGIEVNSGG